MSTPKPQDNLDDFMAMLDADFGKKPKDTAKTRNAKWHKDNQPLGLAAPSVRPHPEDSDYWRPIARVTFVHVQECATCLTTTDYTGCEYIKFRAITGLAGGEILRKASNCPTLFLMDDIEQPLEDLIEWQYEKVARCPGCIRVEQHAQAILWDEHLRQQAAGFLEGHAVIDITQPLPEPRKKRQQTLELEIDLGD